MTHFWTADDPPEIRRTQAQDWIEDLAEFSPEVVNEACGRWRRAETRRPTIAALRAFCIEERAARAENAALEGPSTRDAYARSIGFSSWLERQDAIAANERRYRRGEEWRAQQAERGAAVPGFTHAAAALGSTAREYTPEEMAAGRRQLGVDPPEGSPA